jgi:hypothetical protein
MSRDYAAAVQPLSQDDVVDRISVETSGDRADDVIGELVGVGVAQRSLSGGPDGRAQCGHDHGFRHRWSPISERCENAILSV